MLRLRGPGRQGRDPQTAATIAEHPSPGKDMTKSQERLIPDVPAPEILAPAGDTTAFLAALAAGADAVYCGLKHFSARMEAENFSTADLARLTELAHSMDRKVYVAMNTLAKPGDLDAAGRLMHRLARDVRPDALITADLAMPALARQAGFQGELHLSTLANVSHQAGLEMLPGLGISRAVLPRELSIDEIKAMARACPQGLTLETFVHGALCFNVSGRCWWSSYMGGKSGLRGRCVQPCRRMYAAKGQRGRVFSCRDLSLDVLVKTLLPLPEVRAWKIEGRKKGAHYVYYTVSAYKLLRDEGDDAQAKKQAVELLEQALGRPATHYRFLSQRPQDPVDTSISTGSGLFMGKVMAEPDGRMFLRPRIPLIPGDLLRIGYQDEPGHRTVPVRMAVPKGGRFDLGKLRDRAAGRFMTKPGAKGAKGRKVRKGRPGPPARNQEQGPAKGGPVFLVDRREPGLYRAVAALKKCLADLPAPSSGPSDFTPAMPEPARTNRRMPTVMTVVRRKGRGRLPGEPALWLSPKSPLEVPRQLAPRMWWWLPPVIWPDEEDQWRELLAKMRKAGASRFMLGAPWQTALFEDPGRARPPEFWAGPFCNASNALALAALKDMGMAGAIVSPELSRDDALALPSQSPLPLGFVTHGQWPAGISRAAASAVRTDAPLQSPMGEMFWLRRYGQNAWIYPSWGLDLRDQEVVLGKAGYAMTVHLLEPKPRSVPQAERWSRFNWELELL